jgi:hypothetical protein
MLEWNIEDLVTAALIETCFWHPLRCGAMYRDKVTKAVEKNWLQGRSFLHNRGRGRY